MAEIKEIQGAQVSEVVIQVNEDDTSKETPLQKDDMSEVAANIPLLLDSIQTDESDDNHDDEAYHTAKEECTSHSEEHMTSISTRSNVVDDGSVDSKDERVNKLNEAMLAMLAMLIKSDLEELDGGNADWDFNGQAVEHNDGEAGEDTEENIGQDMANHTQSKIEHDTEEEDEDSEYECLDFEITLMDLMPLEEYLPAIEIFLEPTLDSSHAVPDPNGWQSFARSQEMNAKVVDLDTYVMSVAKFEQAGRWDDIEAHMAQLDGYLGANSELGLFY